MARQDDRHDIAAFGDVHYPIVGVTPLEENKGLVGFDLGADDRRRQALEEAMQSGLATCIVSRHPSRGADPPASYRDFFVPAFLEHETGRANGVATAALTLNSLLDQPRSNEYMALTFSMVTHGSGDIKELALSRRNDAAPDEDISLNHPVLAFGKTFIITAHAGKAYTNLFPPFIPWFTLLIDLVLTALLTVLICTTYRKREHLEELVAMRGRDWPLPGIAWIWPSSIPRCFPSFLSLFTIVVRKSLAFPYYTSVPKYFIATESNNLRIAQWTPLFSNGNQHF